MRRVLSYPNIFHTGLSGPQAMPSVRLNRVSWQLVSLQHCAQLMAAIAKPQAIDNPESSYNRKHFYSVNLTAFCENTACFVHVNVCHPGSWHDARVYRMTEVARVLQEDSQSLLPDGMHIIGDAAYPL
ncbi:UNVERIFIED_CONTAM: hypothetical protein FKN15_070884 [Acipenser sinensis]